MKKLIMMVVVVVMAGCHGAPYTIPQHPQGWTENVDYEVIGNVKVSSTGMLLFGFIPAGKNDMFQRAYEKALEENKATVILKPTVDEYWYYTPVGNIFKLKLSGQAVRKINK